MSRPRPVFGPQPGRLVATMLRALAAELSDPGRYSRAKAYARDGAVIEIDVQPQVTSGLVLGSRRDPYEVLVAVDPVPGPELAGGDTDSVAFMTMLIPGRDELAVSCTCPDADGGQLCKHALALLLVLADEVGIEPDLLIRWRTGTTGEDRRGPSPRRPDRHGPNRSAVPPPAPPIVRVDPLAGMLAASGELPVLPVVAPRPLVSPPAVALDDPVTRLLHDLTVSALGAATGRR